MEVKITFPLLLSQEMFEALKITGRNHASDLKDEIHIGTILNSLWNKRRVSYIPFQLKSTQQAQRNLNKNRCSLRGDPFKTLLKVSWC
jgi:hypothetical protein